MFNVIQMKNDNTILSIHHYTKKIHQKLQTQVLYTNGYKWVQQKLKIEVLF